MEILNYQTGMQGIQRAVEGMERSANTIARSTGEKASTQDMTTAMVENMENQRMAEASTQVVKSVDEMNESIIDLRA
jgi:flagellar basal body rod protein FlgG